MHSSPLIAWTFTLSAILSGCGDTDTKTDASDATDAETTDTGTADTEDSASPDGDTTDSRSPDTSSPLPCDPDAACTLPLLADGACPAACIPQPDRLTCPNPAVHGVCRTTPDAPMPDNSPQSFGDLTITPLDVPRDATVGDTASLTLRLDNTGSTALNLPFSWRHPGTWDITDATWEDLSTLTLAPQASVTWTATLTARSATTLALGPTPIASFAFGDDAIFELFATVHFASDQPIACGGEFFPASHCRDSACQGDPDLFPTAVCCDGIFYPGANCCSDADCEGMACADGQCIRRVPAFASAPSLAQGQQIIRLVLLDTHTTWADPCADHTAEFQAQTDLSQVEAWFDRLAMDTVQRDVLTLRWVVTGGIQTSDFLQGSSEWGAAYDDLDAYLTARGCPLSGSSDRVIIAGPSVETHGFGGFYHGFGQIGVKSAAQPLLLAHELAHSWGATDRYLDLAGSFLYPFALMTSYFGPTPPPTAQVAWAELGFGDHDRDGVIDLNNFSTLPASIAVTELRAVLTARDTIELSWRFRGEESDGSRRVILVPTFTVQLPELRLSATSTQFDDLKSVSFDATGLDLSGLRQNPYTQLRIQTTYGFTDSTWQHRMLELNQAKVVTLEIKPTP